MAEYVMNVSFYLVMHTGAVSSGRRYKADVGHTSPNVYMIIFG